MSDPYPSLNAFYHWLFRLDDGEMIVSECPDEAIKLFRLLPLPMRMREAAEVLREVGRRNLKLGDNDCVPEGATRWSDPELRCKADQWELEDKEVSQLITELESARAEVVRLRKLVPRVTHQLCRYHCNCGDCFGRDEDEGPCHCAKEISGD